MWIKTFFLLVLISIPVGLVIERLSVAQTGTTPSNQSSGRSRTGIQTQRSEDGFQTLTPQVGSGFDRNYGIELAADKSYLINRKCRVQLIREIDVPSMEAGQIKSVDVKENTPIQAKQALAHLRDEAAELQLEIAQKNYNVAKVDAENENRLKFAREGLAMAQDLLKRKEELNRKGTIPFFEYKTAQLEAVQAQLQLDEAGTQKRVALEKLALEQVNIQAARDLIARHVVESLIDGQVAEIYVQPGEWVNRGDKVMRVIQMNPLRIDGRANSREMFPHDLEGKNVTVSLKTPDRTVEEFNGVVARVNLENSVSDKYFFVVEVTNRKRGNHWLLRPNAEVDIKVILKP